MWAKYWYKEVETTTSFRAYKPKEKPVPERMLGVLEACQNYYRRLIAPVWWGNHVARASSPC